MKTLRQFLEETEPSTIGTDERQLQESDGSLVWRVKRRLLGPKKDEYGREVGEDGMPLRRTKTSKWVKKSKNVRKAARGLWW